MKNWRTTVSGIAAVGSICTSIAGSVPALATTIPVLAVIQPYLLLIGLVAGAINSYFQKDKDVTGGTIKQ